MSSNLSNSEFPAPSTALPEQLIRRNIVEAQERANLAIESAELGTIEVDLLSGESIASPRFDAIFGVENPGRHANYVAHIHPDDLPKREAAYQRARETGLLDYETRVIRPDGTIRWVQAKGRFFYDEAGTPYKLIGISQDVTENRRFAEELERQVQQRTAELEASRLELERTVEELRRTNQNLEEFAYAASHDLKEPVRKMRFFSDRLRHSLHDRLTIEERRLFERMDMASLRMGTLIDDLLTFSQVNLQPLQPEAVALDLVVENVLQDLELEIEEKKARIDVQPLPVINGHSRQLQQAFQNLIANALKYTRAGADPRIRITAERVGGEAIPLLLSEAERAQAFHRITVSDNGIGFEPQHAERIFHVFTRLHGNTEYRGTGVGLAIVRKVLENHRGFITAEGENGKGARFHVYLPEEAS